MTFRTLGKTLAVLFAVIATFVVSTPAFAAGNTWVPEFNPEQHVYVAPALENHPTRPFTLDAQFARELEQLAAKHQLDVYVIATEQGDDLTGDRKRWAPDHLHNQVWQKWSHASGFKESRILIIESVRGSDNPAQMSTAARVGSALQNYGITRQKFFDQNGPVFTAIRAHMPQDPRACFLGIVANVNTEIDKYLAANAQPGTPANQPTTSTPPAQPSSGGGWSVLVWTGIVAAFAFGIIAILVVRASSARREAEERERRMRTSRPAPGRPTSGPTVTSTPPGQNPPPAAGTSDGSNAATIAGAAVGGAVLGHVLTRDHRDRRRDDSGSGTTSGADTTTPIVTGGSSCGSSSSDSGSSGGGGGCGGGGCGGGGCGGGGCGGS